MKLTTRERLFLYDNIDEDELLYVASRKGAVLNLFEIYNDPELSSKQKESILVTIAKLCGKGYTIERKDNQSVRITLKGRWRRVYTNPTYPFWTLILAIAAIIAAYHIGAMSTLQLPKTEKIGQPPILDSPSYHQKTNG